jgi:preprotein translocase subunit SecG
MDSSPTPQAQLQYSRFPRLSPQTWVLAVAYFLSTVAFVALSAAREPKALVWLLVALPFSALLLYDTECLVRGNCSAWAWVRTTLYILLPVIFIILVVLGLTAQQKPKDDRRSRHHDRH